MVNQVRFETEREAELTEFAGELACCLAGLCEGGPLEFSLSVPFGINASMKRHGLGLDEVVIAVLELRRALLALPGLDAVSEPVPLRVPDRAVFVLNLAVYLGGLLDRAAGVLGVSRGEAADAALELLRSN